MCRRTNVRTWDRELRMTQTTYSVVPRLQSARNIAFVIGILGVVAAAVGAVIDPLQFFPAYLVGYFFWTGLALGCLALALLHQLAGGMWGAVMLRFLEAGAATLPLLLILFIPIALGLSYLYPWARPADVAHDAILQHQSLYLNVPFYLIRTVFYFAIWIFIAQLLRRWSQQRDETDTPRLTSNLRWLGALGLAVFVLTASFATMDWIMSLEPHWYSTIYPAMVIMGAVLSAFAFIILVVAWLDNRAPLSQVLAPGLFNDLGSLLLAFVMLWAYLGFSQFLLMYAGNLTDEIPWYLNRTHGGWQIPALMIAILEFGLPFALLVFRDVKRHARPLALVAGLLVLMRIVEVYWLVIPAFSPNAFVLSWIAFPALIGIGGIWLALFLWQLARYPLLPRHDRRLVEEAKEEFAKERAG